MCSGTVLLFSVTSFLTGMDGLNILLMFRLLCSIWLYVMYCAVKQMTRQYNIVGDRISTTGMHMHVIDNYIAAVF